MRFAAVCIVYMGVRVCHLGAMCEESSTVITVLLTDGLARALLGAHCYEKIGQPSRGSKNPDEPDCPPLGVCV